MSTQMSGPAAASAEEMQLIKSSAARLQRDFDGIFGIETIERFMADSFARLAHVRVRAYVPVMAERFTRDRLRAIAKNDGTTASDGPAVLFLCVHNAGRSQMAAGWMRHLAGDRVDVVSGGSDPASEVNPAAVEAMAEVGIDIAGEFPRPWTDEIVGATDVVVTMACGDACRSSRASATWTGNSMTRPASPSTPSVPSATRSNNASARCRHRLDAHVAAARDSLRTHDDPSIVDGLTAETVALTVATLRTKLVGMPARVVRSARTIKLRFPRNWPWKDAYDTALTTIRAIPAPT